MLSPTAPAGHAVPQKNNKEAHMNSNAQNPRPAQRGSSTDTGTRLAAMLQRSLALLVIGAALTACSGSGGSDAAFPTAAPEQQTHDNADRPGDGQQPAQDPTAADPVATDPDAAETPDAADEPYATDDPHTAPDTSGAYYKRAYDYPEYVTLPLQFVTLSDGRRLAVRVTLPADANGNPVRRQFPTLLVQTAYNMSLISLLPMPGGALLSSPDPFLVRHGYAQVSVDVAGTGVSEGAWKMLDPEEQKGYGEVVDWVLQQPWCNGRIGVSGASYMAITGLFTAQQRPDAVKAVFASVPMGDAMRGTVGTGGLINAVFMSYWLRLTQVLTTKNSLTELLFPQYRDQIRAATQQHIDQIDTYYLPIIDSALNGDDEINYDGEFWRVRSPIENIDAITAPTFILGALHDIFQRDEPLLYERLKKNVDSRLVIYDGDHMTNFVQAFLGTKEVDPIVALMLQWFDKHLKGIDSGTEQIAPVTQYVKNYKEGFWHGFASTTDWPHPLATPERWYLHGDLTLDRSAPVQDEPTQSAIMGEFAEGTAGKSRDGKRLEFDITLHDGTRCSVSYRQWTLGMGSLFDNNPCFYDNTELEADALNYESEVFTEDYYINGPIQADIWMETTGENSVLSVRLDEVYPDGSVKPLSNGLLLASLRAVDESRSRFLDGEMIQPYHYFTKEHEQFVEPGEVFKMQVEIFPTSALIRKGQKLRVSISTSNQAQGIVNYALQEQMRGSIVTIHNSAEHPSSIVLPIVPVSELQ
jgi:putative CocE/NonD family hydrolase